MMLVIANKLKDYIDSSELRALNYESIVGCYPLETLIQHIKEQSFDMILIDLTAIQDIYNSRSWNLFATLVDPTNIYILHSGSQIDSVTMSTLVNNGLYNIGSNIQEIISFIKTPNTYTNIMKKMTPSRDIYNQREGKTGETEYQRWSQYQKDMMRNYIKKQRVDVYDGPKQTQVIKDQIISGFIVLPILTFLSTALFYLFERVIYSIVPTDGNLGEALYTKFSNLNFNLLVILGLLISSLIFSIYYSVINSKIKRKQYTRGKFMIVSMAVYSLIFIGDYHLFSVFDDIFVKIPIISRTDYLYADFYTYNYLVCIVAIFTYYFKLMIDNSKVFRFEKDFNQRFNLFEKAYAVILVALVLIPIIYYISRSLFINSAFYKLFEKLYVNSNLMVIMIIIGMFLTIMNALLYLLKLDKSVKVRVIDE